MLASPIIEGTLPAFYLENGTATIAVPFSRSRAVSDYDVNGYSLKIKNLQGSEYLLTLSHSRFDSSESIVYFDVLEDTVKKVFSVGSFYKAQMAYVDRDGLVGYYSTVGILKYTTKPDVSILGLKSMKNNGHQYSYTGIYSQKGKDFTEKAYSYRFVVKNSNNGIVEDTGFIVHNHSTDTNQYESQDVFLFSKDLPPNEKYSITYTVRTNNDLEVSSPTYKIVAQTSVVSTLISEISTSLDYDNGYVAIKLKGEIDPNTGLERLVKGSFMLSRTSEKSNFLDWETIDCFNLTSSKPSLEIWKDFAVEQGVRYKYCIQQYNKQNLFSQRLISNEVYVDFEDAFLYDGKRQLKIRFNPKVSSFKQNLLEAKIDTIGSQYPFIFKNGNVGYKEFPISGLISRTMDEQNLFREDSNLILPEQGHRKQDRSFIKVSFPSETSDAYQAQVYEKNYMTYYVSIFTAATGTSKMWKWTDYLSSIGIPVNQHHLWTYCADQLKNNINRLYVSKCIDTKQDSKEELFLKTADEISSNIFAEREFKLDVLDWLTNGQPKLFKSPNEGNYLVRLMNVSLTPEDQLGRMLHNFSCTAYEIDKFTYDAMIKYGIINISNEDSKYLKIISVPLQTYDANWANLSGIEFDPSPKRHPTGPYYAQGDLLKMNRMVEWATLEDMEPGTKLTIDGESITIGASGKYHIPMTVSQISLDPGQKSTGILTYAYYGEINDSFSQVVNTNIDEVIGRQFIGAYDNVIDLIKDNTTQVSSFYNIRLLKRPIQDCYMSPYTYYERIDYTYEFYLTYKDNYKNYFVEDKNIDGGYIPAPEIYDPYLNYYKAIIKQKLITENGDIIAKLGADGNVEETIKPYNYNPLTVYHFTSDYSGQLKTALYRKVKFIPTEHQDTGFFAEDGSGKITSTLQDRTYLTRTSTNPYLMNEQDFFLYGSHGMLYQKYTEINENEKEVISFVPVYDFNFFGDIPADIDFYIKEDIDFYLDLNNPKELYISQSSYKGFIEDMGLISIYPYKKYSYVTFINSNETAIDLTTKEVFDTGPMNDIKIITTPVGIYLELFYQTLSLEYDLSSNYNLQIIKKTLDVFKEKLSKDYMIKKCIESTEPEDKRQYLRDLEYIYENYSRLYSDYLTQLNLYLKAKEEA